MYLIQTIDVSIKSIKQKFQGFSLLSSIPIRNSKVITSTFSLEIRGHQRSRNIGSFDCVDLLVTFEEEKYRQDPQKEHKHENHDFGNTHRIIVHLVFTLQSIFATLLLSLNQFNIRSHLWRKLNRIELNSIDR